MTLEREVDPELRAMLMANEPFEYAHLIKFERPSRPDNVTGRASTAAIRYTHITDASRDIGFDDGSKDTNGVSNGTQTYRANKVLRVSEVSESVEARASSFTVTLDGNGIGAAVGIQGMNITDVGNNQWDIKVLDTFVNLVDEGFREGDKISIFGGQFGDYNIVNFRADNVVRVSRIDTSLTTGTFQIGMQLASEEVKSILLDKSLPEHASFVNREVFIYKVYQQNGTTVGKPVLLFKGIITGASFDDGDDGIKIQWSLSSHWGDFAQVKGRMSSDDFHRALDQNGNPQPESALKPEYAYDKGFIHSETSLNILAKYSVQVEKQDIKTKKGFLGIGAKVKVKKYYVDEARFSQLDFQLAARSIPLHYGVRLTEGFPIFADTLVDDSSTVYVIYALGEGPIGAIYDIILDGKSLICSNKGDLDARGTQTDDDTVDILCRGRADRGDVLGGVNSVNTAANPVDYFQGDNESLAYTNTARGITANMWYRNTYQPYIQPTEDTGASAEGRGVVHGETISLSSPIDMTLDFFSGREGQEAASQLVELSRNKRFKIQNDYWTGTDTAEYWGPNHTLSDTAYVVAKYKISEGETTIPSLEFVLSNKIVECYNYDYSYRHSDRATENVEAFILGNDVDLFRSDTNEHIGSVQIIDKWVQIDGDGNVDHRFRFSSPPDLNYNDDGVPSITKFYMKNSLGNDTWTMETFNHVEHEGTIAEEMTTDVTPVDVGGNYSVPVPPTWVTPTPVVTPYNAPDLAIPASYDSGTSRYVAPFRYQRVSELGTAEE